MIIKSILSSYSMWCAVAQLVECLSVRQGIQGLLVRVSPPAESLCCGLEQDTLSTDLVLVQLKNC